MAYYNACTAKDAKTHAQVYTNDSLGRLVQVVEHSGNDGIGVPLIHYSYSNLSYTALDQPVSHPLGNGLTESYTYNGDGVRVSRVSNSKTTIYMDGLFEEVIGGAPYDWTTYVSFGGSVIAMRRLDNNAYTANYILNDHLGSVSFVINSNNGAVVSQQEFDPWGAVRSGSVPQTTRNYTGQQLDDTGLLFYNARYYDPGIGRFVSADTIVPGSGTLTVWPSDSTAAGCGGSAKVGQAIHRS
jgi:RHS repeat-associated protein